MLKKSNLSYNEFLTEFGTNDSAFTERGLCEVLKLDEYYTYVTHTFVNEPYVGFFIANLSDGLAFIPVTEIHPDKGYEQIEFECIRLIDKDNDDDRCLLEEVKEHYEAVLTDIKSAIELLS